MRKIEAIRFSRGIWIRAGLLLFLGISFACDSSDSMDVSYASSIASGSPSVVYTINGKVTQDGLPAENVFVGVFVLYEENGNVEQSDTLYTDKEGLVTFVRTDTPRDHIFNIITKDRGGSLILRPFETDTTVVRFTMNDLYEAGIRGPWDSGKVEKSVHIKLRKRGLSQTL